MKPLHVFLLLYAIFITGLADGISLALSIIPGLGVIIDLVIAFSINATMGSGLMLLLMMNGMYHPKWGPAGFIGGLIPGLDFLPFWLGVVIAGIFHDIAQSGGALAPAAKLAEDLNNVYKAGGSPLTKMKTAASAVNQARQPQNQDEGVNTRDQAAEKRAPNTLPTKNFDGIKPYVPKAA